MTVFVRMFAHTALFTSLYASGFVHSGGHDAALLAMASIPTLGYSYPFNCGLLIKEIPLPNTQSACF